MPEINYKAFAIINPVQDSIDRSIHKANSPYRPPVVYTPNPITRFDDEHFDETRKEWLLVYKITTGVSFQDPVDTNKVLIGGNYWKTDGGRVKDIVRGNSTKRKSDAWNRLHVQSICQQVVEEVIFTDPQDTPLHRADIRRVLNGVVDSLEDGDVTAAHYELYRLKNSTSQHVNVGNIYTKADGIFKKLYQFYPWLDVTRSGNE